MVYQITIGDIEKDKAEEGEKEGLMENAVKLKGRSEIIGTERIRRL